MSETIGVLDSSSTGVPDEPTTSGEASSTGAADEVPPVAWYTFDDAQDLYADASGNALHAWCGEPECPVWVEGIVGNGAIRVDGIEDHLHVDQVPALAITDELTIAVWASVNAPAPGNQEFRSIFAKPIGAATLNTWQIGVDARGQLCGGGGNAIEQRGACAAVEEPVGVWHHIALTWSGDQLTLYVDGIARDSNSTVELEYDDIWVMIGADVNNGEDAAFFEGTIDDARIYDRVLDDDAILALFELAR